MSTPSTDILWELQKAMTVVLKTDAQIQSICTGIFDTAPANQPYPYITIGEATQKNDDSFDGPGEDILTTMHIWSQEAGFKEALAIKFRMYQLLHRQHQNLIMNGYSAYKCYHDFSATLRDPDGLTRHVITRYRILAE